MDTVVIFAGGEALLPAILDDLPIGDLVVAADGGYDQAVALGRRVDVLVGDLDSIETEELADDVIIERHAPNKDATDLDLALELVARDAPSRVVVVGGAGGRLDHEIAIAELLCSSRWAVIDDIDWVSGRGWAFVVRGRRVLHGDIGSTLSLIPVGGDAVDITTSGLKWDLHGETLPHASTRGVSNVMKAPVADIRVGQGCLLAVVPAQPPSPSETAASSPS